MCQATATHYCLVKGQGTLDLQNQVNDKILEGWQPFGAPVFWPAQNPSPSRSVYQGDWFVQAMIKVFEE